MENNIYHEIKLSETDEYTIRKEITFYLCFSVSIGIPDDLIKNVYVKQFDYEQSIDSFTFLLHVFPKSPGKEISSCYVSVGRQNKLANPIRPIFYDELCSNFGVKKSLYGYDLINDKVTKVLIDICSKYITDEMKQKKEKAK